MTMDGNTLEYLVWIATALSLFLFIPKSKVRLALVAFLFVQVLAWPLGLLFVNIGWLQYPVRLFENATQTSFTYEYFFYPVIGAYFIIYFPDGKGLAIRAAYYALYCSILTLAELLILHYTNLIRYIHWNAYFTWVTLFITLYITRKFCLWFYKPYTKS